MEIVMILTIVLLFLSVFSVLIMKFLGKEVTIRISTLLLICLFTITAWSLYWLAGRYSVGTFRHALDHQGPKDAIYLVLSEWGKKANAKYIISPAHPRFIGSDLAKTDFVYRYEVVDVSALDNQELIFELIKTMRAQKYKTQIVFVENGKQVLSIDNIDKRGI